MSSKQKGPLSEKVEEIKRMQTNWMRERSLQIDDAGSSRVEAETHPVARRGREKSVKKSSETGQKGSDVISWTVNSGVAKKKPLSSATNSAKTAKHQPLRTRSASPARTAPSTAKRGVRASSRRGDSQPSSARSNVSNGSRPPLGRNQPLSQRGEGSSRSGGSGRKGSERVIEKCKNGETLDVEEVSGGASTFAAEEKAVRIYKKFTSDPNINDRQRYDVNHLQSGDNSDTADDFSEGNFDSISRRPGGIHHPSEERHCSRSEQSLPARNRDGGPPESNLRHASTINPDAFDRLADQIASRVKAEMREERRDVTNRVGRTSKSELLDEEENGVDDADQTIEGHHCSKCKQLMMAPDHAPTILIPCGHTFCEACAEDRIKCPTCRTRVSSTSLNSTLQAVVIASLRPSQRQCPNASSSQGSSDHIPASHIKHTQAPSLSASHHAANQRTREYTPAKYANSEGQVHSATGGRLDDHGDGTRNANNARGRMRENGGCSDARTEDTVGATGAMKDGRDGAHRRRVSPEEEARRLEEEYQSLGIRCEALESEETDVLQRVENQNRNIAQHKQQMGSITQKQQQLREEIKDLEERLAGLESHRQEYKRQVEDAEDRKREELDQLAMVRSMLRDMQRNRERVKMAARKFKISLD